MNKMKCQYPHKDKTGCSFCGGFKVIVEKIKCGKKGCKHAGWLRPGPRTVYEGKSMFTVDGLELIYHKSKLICVYCLEGK